MHPRAQPAGSCRNGLQCRVQASSATLERNTCVPPPRTTSVQLRELYSSAAEAVLPDNGAAAQAVRDFAEDATANWRVIADVQEAALAASLQATD